MASFRYYVTDRNTLGGVAPLIENIERQILAGVDWIQLREKDLPTPDLLRLARQVVGMAGRTKIVINSRLDVALASGAYGIHLPSHSPPPSSFKRIAPHLAVGVSCHDRAELVAAQEEGADYVFLGPVFAPRSKVPQGPSLGLERFAQLVQSIKIPVIALGGITLADIAACERAGATGVAGISLFQRGE